MIEEKDTMTHLIDTAIVMGNIAIIFSILVATFISGWECDAEEDE